MQSDLVLAFITEALDGIFAAVTQEMRASLLNKYAEQYGIKLIEPTKKLPISLEMVKNNFREVVNSLKLYEHKQIQLEQGLFEI